MHSSSHTIVGPVIKNSSSTPNEPSTSDASNNFDKLGLSPSILKALKEDGYTVPTAIQAEAIPIVNQGRDLMAAAQTGTGKTAGFTLPLLKRLSEGDKAKPNQVRALILAPTRELAQQIGESVESYGRYLPLKSTVVFGGVKINPQMMKLRRGVDILVATPGRLLDLYNQNAVRFKQLEVVVLDEADRMLDMGFIHDIKKILSFLPPKRQSLLFSATFSDDIRSLARGLLVKPIEVSVTPRNATAKTVKQWISPVDKKQKPGLFVHIYREQNWGQVLIFCRTKHGANKLTRFLCAEGIKSAAIHGDKSQNARQKALKDFKQGDVSVLVATDIAARGIDIDQLPLVVNFDLPNVAEDYVHRIGRTGRANAQGTAISLVAADEIDQLRDIERLLQRLLERRLVDGFEPVHDLPESRLINKPHKNKRPKKPRTEHRDGQREPSAGKRGNPRSGKPTSGAKPNTQRKTSGAKPSSGNGAASKSTQERRAPRKRVASK